MSNENSATQLSWEKGPRLREKDIAGVMVRRTGWIEPLGWQPDDLAYMQAETQAALLAWLWSLPCPVVNRYPPAIWYQPKLPLLSWHRLLRGCGLPTLQTMITNVEQESRAFRQRLALKGVAGAVYGPLTSDLRYLVTDDKDWTGLASMLPCAPVCLTCPHEAPQFVCVVGGQVVWEGQAPAEMTPFEPGLRAFAAAAGLDFVELALAHTAHGIAVVSIDPHPGFEHFGDAARHDIVEGIMRLLTAEKRDACLSSPQHLPGSLV